MRYIKIYNRLTSAIDDNYLTPDELMLYATISIEKNLDNELNTSYDILKYMVRVGRNKRLLSNRREVERCMKNIADKGIITLSEINKNLISVRFNEIDGGYERLYVREFERICNARELSIYMAVKKWKDKNN